MASQDADRRILAVCLVLGVNFTDRVGVGLEDLSHRRMTITVASANRFQVEVRDRFLLVLGLNSRPIRRISILLGKGNRRREQCARSDEGGELHSYRMRPAGRFAQA